MAEEDRLRDLLARVAAGIDEPDVSVDHLVGRARRRRRRVQSMIAGTTTLAVTAIIVVPLALAGGKAPGRLPSPPTSASPPASASPLAGPGSAAALASDHWSALPAAPIQVRSRSAAVWDGHEMLVWGGSDTTDSRVFGDGAAYDPAMRRWRLLPRSPLTPRADMAYAWTGRYLFIWGGATPGAVGFNDGALYDPAANTWRLLPRAPLGTTASPRAVWTGHQVVVTATDGPSAIAAYDPVANAWHRLPALPSRTGSTVWARTLAAADGELYVWDERATRDFAADITLYRYAGRWLPTPTTGSGPPFNVTTPLWTGKEFLMPPAQQCPPGASCPSSTYQHGYRWDPATGRWAGIPAGPGDRLAPTAVWTGAALLEADTVTRPGQAAAWDPATGSWRRLPTASSTGSQVAMVWAGDRLLEWGQTATGLQLAP